MHELSRGTDDLDPEDAIEAGGFCQCGEPIDIEYLYCNDCRNRLKQRNRRARREDRKILGDRVKDRIHRKDPYLKTVARGKHVFVVDRKGSILVKAGSCPEAWNLMAEKLGIPVNPT